MWELNYHFPKKFRDTHPGIVIGNTLKKEAAEGPFRGADIFERVTKLVDTEDFLAGIQQLYTNSQSQDCPRGKTFWAVFFLRHEYPDGVKYITDKSSTSWGRGEGLYVYSTARDAEELIRIRPKELDEPVCIVLVRQGNIGRFTTMLGKLRHIDSRVPNLGGQIGEMVRLEHAAEGKVSVITGERCFQYLPNSETAHFFTIRVPDVHIDFGAAIKAAANALLKENPDDYRLQDVRDAMNDSDIRGRAQQYLQKTDYSGTWLMFPIMGIDNREWHEKMWLKDYLSGKDQLVFYPVWGKDKDNVTLTRKESNIPCIYLKKTTQKKCVIGTGSFAELMSTTSGLKGEYKMFARKYDWPILD